MSRRNSSAIVVLFAMILLFATSPAGALELRDHASLVSGMVGWTHHQSQLSGNDIDGASWSFDYARVGGHGQWSLGVLLRHFESDEKFVDGSSGGEVTKNSKRLVTAARGTFYIRQGRVTPYASMFLGVHMQTTELFDSADGPSSLSSQTLATGFSGGSNFLLTPGIFLRAEYTFHYFADSETVKNNIMHGVYAGVGFQFGGGN